MKLWKYDVLEMRTQGSYPPAEWVELLNQCGALGWELVAVKVLDGRGYGVLKKPVE